MEIILAGTISPTPKEVPNDEVRAISLKVR